MIRTVMKNEEKQAIIDMIKGFEHNSKRITELETKAERLREELEIAWDANRDYVTFIRILKGAISKWSKLLGTEICYCGEVMIEDEFDVWRCKCGFIKYKRKK